MGGGVGGAGVGGGELGGYVEEKKELCVFGRGWGV